LSSRKSLAIAFTVLLAGNCHCKQRGFRDYLSSVESGNYLKEGYIDPDNQAKKTFLITKTGNCLNEADKAKKPKKKRRTKSDYSARECVKEPLCSI